MAANFNAMVDLVRGWSNRDDRQLSTPVIEQCLRFAADTAYRQLTIPPLENTTQALIISEDTVVTANGNNNDLVDGEGNPLGSIPNTIPVVRVGRGGGEINAVTREVRIPVPGDLVSFIHLRIQGSPRENTDGTIMIDSDNQIVTDITSTRRFGIVFNEKADVRTYHDLSAEKYDANYWTRQGNDILMNGFLSPLDVVEIYYYRRLAALGSTFLSGDNMGEEVPNWLIEENEKVILFGALWQAFDYLQDPALSQVYFVKFGQAIEELNEEERMRKASGGNVQVNFNGRGLI